MHLIGIKRDLVERHPWLPASLFKAFLQAKTIALREVNEIDALRVTLPWLVAEAQQTAALMGEDFWRYGVRENANEIETLTRYAYEQGLTSRKLQAEDLFPASVIESSKI
jgi:4,5-dihydroxyphthalate decarboxylase